MLRRKPIIPQPCMSPKGHRFVGVPVSGHPTCYTLELAAEVLGTQNSQLHLAPTAAPGAQHLGKAACRNLSWA